MREMPLAVTKRTMQTYLFGQILGMTMLLVP